MNTAADTQLTGGRLYRVIFTYLVMMIAVVTLSPFRFSPEPLNVLSSALSPFDVLANVVLFAPVGFVHQLFRPRTSALAWKTALIIGFSLSALIETAQFFAPGRFPSPIDLTTNTMGAVAGAGLAKSALGRVDGIRAGRALGIELPLMGLVYMLAPLAWLHGLGSSGDGRIWLLLVLAASGGWIMGSVFTLFDRMTRPRLLLATAAWLAVALLPGAVRSPSVFLAGALAGLGSAWLRTFAPASLTMEASTGGRAPRRFEAATLRAVLPLLFTHLVVSSVTPFSDMRQGWSGTLALLPEGQDLTNAVMLRALEHIVAFTVAGYLIAEYHSRARDRFPAAVPIILIWTGPLSSLLELARGWNSVYGASAMMFVLTISAAGLGGWLYFLQLAHVRAMSARGLL